MENEDSLMLTVRDNLEKLGYDFDKLEPATKQYLLKIEGSVDERFKKEREAKELASRNTISVKGISKDTGISRQTFYNNPILAEYVSLRSKKFEKVDASLLLKEKDDRIRELEKEIEDLHLRDVEYMEMKRKNEDQKDQIKQLKETIELNRSMASRYHIESNCSNIISIK